MISLQSINFQHYILSFFFIFNTIEFARSELLKCESNISGLPHCEVQLTRNGTGLESCHQLSDKVVIVTISYLVQNVSFVCQSKDVLETRIVFEYDAPIVHYTNVRRRRKSGHSEEYTHELNISIPTTPRILGPSKKTTLVRYRVYNTRNVTNPSAHVNVLFYVLQYSWNMTFNEKIHWMQESRTIRANQEIILIPCLSVLRDLFVFRLTQDTENTNLIKILRVDPDALTYDPINGLWMNTTKVDDFEGQYLCSVFSFLENTTSMEELKEMTSTQKIVQFSIEYPPEIEIEPPDQLLLADDQPTTDKLYNLQIKGEPMTLSCSSVKSKVNITVATSSIWSGNLKIDVKSYQVTKPENRSYSVATISHVGQEACIRREDGEECKHDILRMKCSDDTMKFLHGWEIRTKQIYTDEEYEDFPILTLEYSKHEQTFTCETRNDSILRHSSCWSIFQCQILANCLRGENGTGMCISSATSLAKSACEDPTIRTPDYEDEVESGIIFEHTCHVARHLPGLKGILQCSTMGRFGIEHFRVKYFVGFDGALYGDTRAASQNATMRLKEYYQDDIYYTQGHFRFRCQAQSFLYEDGIIWLEQYKNGTQRIVPNHKLTMISSGWGHDDENPESVVEILFDDEFVEKIICAAPKVYTNKAWDHISVDVTVRDSIPPIIPEEGTMKNFRVGDTDQSLTCSAGGFPRPDIKWTFDDKDLEVDSKFQVVDKVISKVLVFPKYEVSLAGEYKCTASNILTDTSQIFQVDTLVEKDSTLLYTLPFVALSILLFASFYAIFMYRRKARLEKYREIDEIVKLLKGEGKKEDGDDYEGFDPLWSSYDESQEMDKVSFFVDREALLGKGEFGEVYKGRLDGVDGHVAFKTTARNAPMANLKMLVSELKIMMYIGPHENVVALLGAYTREIKHGVLYVATEYCGLGCLETYLRSYKHLFIRGLTFSDEEFGMSRTSGIHKYQQLYAWCGQIANAMEYLNSKKVIHSDLATRNILLTADAIAKVTDFGLSRRTYKYTEYVKKGMEPLPWQWLAPEALKTHTFSVETDIWAYGVTLWEIFSFGDIPYGGLGWTQDFGRQLESGTRCAKPEHTRNEIYAIMLSCWDLNAKQRPNFSTLRESFEKMLSNWHYVTTEIIESQNPAITTLETGYVDVAFEADV